MKFTTTAILAVAGVGALRVVQMEHHRRQQNEIAVARIQLDRIRHLTAHPHLAESWAPSGMAVDKYVKLLDANYQLCAISLRHELGIVRGHRLDFVAKWFMKHEVGRQYWEEFGPLRAEEAAGDSDLEEFTEVMNDAYKAHSKAEPVGV
ncbi:DUF6082 family protein [Streptomyces angustmyceticus]|uniref:DUF6082 family protein n=1 Tax=Streptomyces angustmyceticus TaxID=285578 RepID=UPI003D8D946D